MSRLGEAAYLLTQFQTWSDEDVAKLTGCSVDATTSAKNTFRSELMQAQIRENLAKQAEEAAKERERRRIEEEKEQQREAFNSRLSELQDTYPHLWGDYAYNLKDGAFD